MRNITVAISDQTYTQARVWAAQRDTSVSAVVEYLLKTLPGIPKAAREFPEPYPVAPNASPAPSANPPASS
jgi:hypothetical protein